MHRRAIPLKTVLVNTPDIELWPGGLLRARSNQHARSLSGADRVLRRKRDGRYLAVASRQGLQPLLPRLRGEPGLRAALDLIGAEPADGRKGWGRVRDLPLHRLHQRLDILGIPETDYAGRTGLSLVAEPDWLAYAGEDRYRRPLWLRSDAARAWLRMLDAARRDQVVLEAISGYRSHDYQLGIFERKLDRGLTIDDILAVNAAPGFSEHHSGLALDIGAPGEAPAEESFERSAAFAWLRANARDHGFVMSYPRDNPHGIVYEPWHWRYAAE